MPPEGTAAPGEATVWRPGQRLLTVGMVTLITIAASEILAVAAAMPVIEVDLQGLALYGWVLSAFMLGNLVGIIVAGRLADRRPLGEVLTAGLVLFVGGLVLGAAAPSMVVLVVARAVQGLGAGAIPAVAVAAVARAYVPAARPRVFALFSTAFILPALIGPGVASRVATGIGWRWVFGGLVPLAVVAGALTVVALRSVRSPDVPSEDVPGDALATVALVVGVMALLGGVGSGSWIAGPPLVAAGGAAVGWGLTRLLPAGTLRLRPGVPASVAVKALFAYAFFSIDFFVPLALTSLRGTTPEYAGAVVTVVSLSWSAAAWVQAGLVRRTGPRLLVRVGFVLVAIGALGLAGVALSEVPVALAFLVWATAGAGAGLIFGPLTAAALAAAEPGREGRTGASLLLVEPLAIAIGTGVAGAIVAAATGGVGSTAGVAGPVAGLAGALAVVFALGTTAAVLGAVLAGRIPATVLDDEVEKVMLPSHDGIIT